MMAVEPASLSEAIAMQPTWLLIWVGILAATNLASLLFIIGRKNGQWLFRPEALAILMAFLAAGSLMEYMYGQLGYVRLLGLAHLVFWVPVYAWIALKRRALYPPSQSLFGKYLLLYLLVSGISLVIDAVDVVRHFVGI
ncbi:MAG: hypothetical protein AB8B54_10450 [Sphingorhabdus sp.]